MMNDTERYYACMNYKPVDRAPTWVWTPWPETIERWKHEGYNPESFDLYMNDDIWNAPHDWFFPYPPFEKKIIEESEDTVLYMNHEGIVLREFKNQPFSSMPQFVKFPVENRHEFHAFWKQRMQSDWRARRGPNWKYELLQLRSEPHPLIILGDRWTGFFGPLRNLLGVERLCMTFYDDPAFIEEMMDTMAEYIIEMVGQILDVVKIDAFIMWEDMAYNKGAIISPQLVRRFMLSRYKKVTEYLFERNVPFIGLDCDGQIYELIPIWIEAGLNFLYPFEVQAGMDVLDVRRKYGKDMRIWGGIDKKALAIGKKAIDKEIDRVKPLIYEGGYVPFTDHSVPPDVSFENYRYYRTKLRQASVPN